MSHKLLRDARVYGVLLRIDQDAAAEARSKGCACGGRLHAAHYPRRAGCGLDLRKLDPEHGRRFSLCCDQEGCRRRKTPPSVRFLGRRVYVGVVVVLIAALAQRVTERRLRRLRRLAGDVSRRTVERWRQWWREAFVQTAFWREFGARFMPPVVTEQLPTSLLERFGADDDRGKLMAMLRFLAPLTAPALPVGRGI